MIPVRIVYKDTATGCETKFDTEVSTITSGTILDAINKLHSQATSDAEPLVMGDNRVLKDAKSDTYAFIIAIDEAPYFGSFLIVGVVYTQFC